MDNFGASQELGGVYVKIGADLSGLQAGVAQARTLASSVSNIRANVPLLTGPGMIGGGASGIGGNSGVNTGGLLSLPSFGPVPAYSGSNTGRGAAGGWDFEGEVVSSTIKTQALLGGPGGGNGSWSYGGGFSGANADPMEAVVAGGAASKWGWGKKVKLKGVKSLGAVYAAYAGAQTMSAGINLLGAATATDGARRQSFIEAGEEDIKGIPFVGGLIGKLGHGIYAAGSATKNLVSGRGFKTDYGLAGDTMEQVAAQEITQARNQRHIDELVNVNSDARAVGKAARLENLSFGKSGAESSAILARDQLKEYKEGIKYNTPETAEALQQLGIRATNLGALASDEAMQRSLDTSNAKQREYQRNKSGYDEINSFASDVVPGEIQQSRRRASGDSFGAARAEVESFWTNKANKAASGSDAQKLIYTGMKQALSEMDSDRSRATTGMIFNSNQDARISGQVANRQFGRAALTAFDRDTTNILAGMRGQDQTAIDAQAKSRASQRNDLWKEQQHQHFERSRELGGMITAANSRGQGFNVLAGVNEMITGMGTALHNEPTESKRMLGMAQQAQLKGLQANLNRPTHYATETNRGFESPGGPSGKDSGKEMLEVQKAMREYLAIIAKALSN